MLDARAVLPSVSGLTIANYFRDGAGEASKEKERSFSFVE